MAMKNLLWLFAIAVGWALTFKYLAPIAVNRVAHGVKLQCSLLIVIAHYLLPARVSAPLARKKYEQRNLGTLRQLFIRTP